VVAHPGEGVAIDGVVGELGQLGPRLQAMRIPGRHGCHGVPTAVSREGPGRVESGGQLGIERVQDGLGAPGGELDCMFGGHPAMLRAANGHRTATERPPNGRRAATERAR
jgi:hypothetical protein